MPAKKVKPKDFLSIFFKLSLSLISTGNAKKGMASVSRQKPIAIEGASITLAKIPELEPAITPSATSIFTYFF